MLAVLLSLPFTASAYSWDIQRKDTAKYTKLYHYGRDRISYNALPLIAGGILLINKDRAFRNLTQNYIPDFRHHYDDYLQFAPAAVMFGLKAAGVEGRSSWGRMMVSDAFSSLLLFSVIQSVKHMDWVQRPNGANYHSFPSGHTATAFLTATMLHKEYGLTRSPWYSVGAYAAAAAVGLSRQLNNEHWLSDVMVGAGLGVMAAELGYYLAGLIFKDRGITREWLPERYCDSKMRPSFLGLYMGYDGMMGGYSYGGRRVIFSSGCVAGLEGAWFITNRFGIGGRLTASTTPYTLQGDADSYYLDVLSAYAGPYFSFPIGRRWLLGTKALAGFNYNFKGQGILDIAYRTYFGLGTGLSVTYMSGCNLGFKVFGDYNMRASSFSKGSGVGHNLALGGTVNIMF